MNSINGNGHHWRWWTGLVSLVGLKTTLQADKNKYVGASKAIDDDDVTSMVLVIMLLKLIISDPIIPD